MIDHSRYPSNPSLKHDDVQRLNDVIERLSRDFSATVALAGDGVVTTREEEWIESFGLHNPWNSKVLDDALSKLKTSDEVNIR